MEDTKKIMLQISCAAREQIKMIAKEKKCKMGLIVNSAFQEWCDYSDREIDEIIRRNLEKDWEQYPTVQVQVITSNLICKSFDELKKRKGYTSRVFLMRMAVYEYIARHCKSNPKNS